VSLRSTSTGSKKALAEDEDDDGSSTLIESESMGLFSVARSSVLLILLLLLESDKIADALFLIAFTISGVGLASIPIGSIKDPPMLRFALSPLTSISLIGADPVFKDKNKKIIITREVLGKRKKNEQTWI
jgi:hypothetical protein